MPFPNYIDNTMRKAFATCPTKFMRAHVQNLRPVGEESIDLAFGRAFARGLEVARKAFFERRLTASGLALAEGIDAALEAFGTPVAARPTYKSAVRLEGALEAYFERYPLGEDGLTPVKGGIECSFSIPLPIMHPETAEPLVYVGRYDMLATDSNNRYYVVDEKTASRLGESWDMKWDMDAQMTGYTWAASYHLEKLGVPLPELEVQALVRGISILKDGYGHVEVPLVRSDWFIHEWHRQLVRDVKRMVASYKEGRWDLAMHENACVQYMRRCDYMPMCMSPNPERLASDSTVYKIEVWNPLDTSGNNN